MKLLTLFCCENSTSMSGIQYKSPRKGIADRTQQFAAHKSSHHGRVTKISERKARKPCPPPSNTPAEVLAMVQLKLREAEGGTEVFDNGFVSYDDGYDGYDGSTQMQDVNKGYEGDDDDDGEEESLENMSPEWVAEHVEAIFGKDVLCRSAPALFSKRKRSYAQNTKRYKSNWSGFIKSVSRLVAWCSIKDTHFCKCGEEEMLPAVSLTGMCYSKHVE